MKIGVTANQSGLSPRQKELFRDYLITLSPSELHGDADIHNIAVFLGIRTVKHPPLNANKQAFCICDEECVCKQYLDRNRDIVDETDILLAGPRTDKEEFRSGTWSTVRYARKCGKVVEILI
jgi:hypothetical protein